MSGGSYDYLCRKDAEQILESICVVERMADRLAKLGYADDAAAATTDVLLELRRFRVRVNAQVDKLREVWREVEWWDSCDSSEEVFKDALAKYRGEDKK